MASTPQPPEPTEPSDSPEAPPAKNSHYLLFVLSVVIVTGVVFALGGTHHSHAVTHAQTATNIPKAQMLIYTGWLQSRHASTQADVATELAASHAGETPAQVIKSEDCIACHAPLAVLANGGMSEQAALGYFFTTKNGRFTSSTAPANQSQWPNVACATCHDAATGNAPGPGGLASFNSQTASYQSLPAGASVDQLCGQCHGNLRFPGTDHMSYSVVHALGGVGVTGPQSMAGIPCTQCHMYSSQVPSSNSAQYAGHSLAIAVQEPAGVTSSCTQSGCHPTWSAAQAQSAIAAAEQEFKTLDPIVSRDVAAATAAMKGVKNQGLQAKLAEAQSNLALAESDESGGFHDAAFVAALLKDADARAQEILTTLGVRP